MNSFFYLPPPREPNLALFQPSSYPSPSAFLFGRPNLPHHTLPHHQRSNSNGGSYQPHNSPAILEGWDPKLPVSQSRAYVSPDPSPSEDAFPSPNEHRHSNVNQHAQSHSQSNQSTACFCSSSLLSGPLIAIHAQSIVPTPSWINRVFKHACRERWCQRWRVAYQYGRR